MYEMYDLNEREVLEHLARDKVMWSVILKVQAAGPFTFPIPTLNVYRDLLEAVIYQQVSIRAARSIFDRFRLVAGEGIDDPGMLAKMDLVQR